MTAQAYRSSVDSENASRRAHGAVALQAERSPRNAMSAPTKPAAEAQRDPTEVLAEKLFVEMAGRVYSVIGGDKPQPKMLAQLAFRLAEVFQQANSEFNPSAIAAREAKAKATVNLDNVHIDFGAVGKPK
jgi:hypothetical protein